MKASEKASMASGKAPRRIIFTFCNLPIKIVTKSRNVGPHLVSGQPSAIHVHRTPPPGKDYTKIILCLSGNKKIGRQFRPNALFQVHWSTYIYVPRMSQFWRYYY